MRAKNKTGKKTYRSKETISIKTETAIPTEEFFFFGAVQSICVIYLIFSAGVRMLKALDKSPFATGVLAAVMLVMVGLSLAGVSVSSILLILLSGAAGVAAWLIGRRKEGK